MEHAHELMLRYRVAPLDMSPCEFRKVGQQVVEQLAEFLCTLPDRPVSPDEATGAALDVLAELDASVALPEDGADARELMAEASQLLCQHVTFSGHPRFMDVSASSPAPIGPLTELLAAAVNARGSDWAASIVSQIEAQTIRWLAEMLGYPANCGGLLLSGDNMGNIAGMLAARAAKVPWDVNAYGLAAGPSHKLRLYASQEAHPWIERAAEMLGLGRASIRRVPVNGQHGMDHRALHRFLQEDTDAGLLPFLVIGTAGTLQTGAVDPLLDLASACHAYKLWFHVDGTYGGCAALVLDQPDTIAVPEDLRGLCVADSLALDAHRWLYAPPDTSFLLLRDPDLSWCDSSLDNNLSHVHNDREEDGANWLSTNGFRALNVWLALRQVGRKGYIEMLSADIELARILDQLVREQPELQPGTQSLSITTFRYVPPDLTSGDPELARYLERLNRRILARLRQGGDALISGVTLSGTFMLRACIVNFRTSLEDIEALVHCVVRLGRDVDVELRPTWM